ncbi:MAG: hypothetical protein SGI73_06355 [Chloroflexota bacterium]|nr:hypothetical protein [Chloroflexota bacterium]
MTENKDPKIETLMETENYVAWMSHEDDGTVVYHLELGSVTLHFFEEEWGELVELIDGAIEAMEAGTEE